MDSIKEAQTARRESLKALVAKVEQLRLQQGILLRKKQREKYAHKDPLLEELTSILDNARLQIKALRQEITDATKKQQQLTKVAEILGIRPCELVDKTAKSEGKDPSPPNTASSKGSDTILKSSQDAKQSELKSGSDTKAKDSISSSDPRSKHCFSSSTSTEKSEESSTQTRGPSPKSSSDNTRPEPKKTSEESKSKSPPPSQLPSSHTAKHSFNLSELFEYYDAGSHWCEQCSVVCRTLEGFLLHLHEKNHLEQLENNQEKRPWAKYEAAKSTSRGKQTISIPLRGIEFLRPTNSFYCELCDELCADGISAEEHLTSYFHNNNYKVCLGYRGFWFYSFSVCCFASKKTLLLIGRKMSLFSLFW
ncbi:hypothetical protein GDO86_017934 [Hymenochirus boettgeri]|uniref:U1-type domain-containing protein n=1 Tax=Hymenochirus boettgeri TaxID=247094 RepID=A0A8T2IBU1_9PIPI|nr:hypothetical protein GDO86_017934 [Hymenochirus boettgeri]